LLAFAMQSATPPAPEEKVESSRGPATVMRPRGILAPPLPKDAPAWQRIRRAIHRLGHGLVLHDVLLAAPAMAFHFFLSLLPLLVFVGYVVGLIARRRGVDAVLSPVLDNLPDTAAIVVKKEVERLAGSGGAALGPVAAATFLWIASGGTHGLMNAVENVVGAPRRPWWKKRVLAVAWVVALLGAFALAAFTIVKWDAVMHPRDARSAAPAASGSTSASSGAPTSASATTLLPSSPRRTSVASSAIPHTQQADPPPPETPRRRRARIIRSGGERALALSLSVLFATAVLAAFYRFSVSHSKRVARRVLPGAALAVVLWLVISWAFGLYVSTLAEYAVFYGSLAAVAVLLVWLWLTSLAILVGAELNSQLEGLRD
jgi:membrane protein